MKSPKNRLHSVMIIGGNPAGIAAANKLGELGAPVTLVDKDTDLNEKLLSEDYRLDSGVPFNYAYRPGLIRILHNPNIHKILPAAIKKIRHTQQGFSVQIEKQQTFIDPSRCTLCGRCVEICPVDSEGNNKPIHINSRFSLPGRAVIEKRKEPPCRTNCPLGVNAQGYVALVKAGRYKEALDLIRRDNVLPAICGRVCTRPCEYTCRRAELDEPIAIRDLKRFASDYALDDKTMSRDAAIPFRKERVAVVGAGPSGIAAAADLARQGFGVTIFEKEKGAGGLLRYAIGSYRLPREILDKEVEMLKSEGVQIVTNRSVSIPRDLPYIRSSFDAVLLSCGSWADRRLGVPGEDLKGVQGCLDFLTRVYRGEVSCLEGKTAVTGDGNAAFDLARTLKRLGSDVTIISWFSKEEIPADPHEVESAVAEGIKIRDRAQVIEFIGTDGVMQCLRLRPTRSGPEDSKGIAWPEIIPDSESFDLSFDQAFVAIGQAGAYRGVHTVKSVDISHNGFIIVDDCCRTGIERVYAAGDAVTGATSVVQAMAQGRKAAAGIMKDLAGLDMSKAPLTRRSESFDYDPVPKGAVHQQRASMPEIDVTKRLDGFIEVALGYDKNNAFNEAARCLQCGSCSECLECLKVCEVNQAILHSEESEDVTENTGVLIIADPSMAPGITGEDVIRAYGPPSAKGDVHAMIQRGFAAAAKAMLLINETSTRIKGHGISFVPVDTVHADDIRIGLFACRCNDSFGWSGEMDDYMKGLVERREIICAESLPSACVPEGVERILDNVREKSLTRIVLASCVCCPLDYVCSACTDQRSRLKEGLFRGTGISRAMVQTCNLRGEVLRMTAQNPSLAVESFKGLIDRSVGQASKLLQYPALRRTFNFTIAVVGQTEATVTSALTLAKLGFDIYMFGTVKNPLEDSPVHPNIHGFIGSEATAISGTLGNFQIRINIGEAERTFTVGSVILGDKSRNIALYHTHRDLPGKTVQSEMQAAQQIGIPFLNPGKTSISGLFLADPPGIQISKNTQGMAAAALAAAAIPRSPRQYRSFSVTINENLCRSCGRCLQVCPYQAIALKQNSLGNYVAVADAILCKGCGNCISVCPSNAADSPFRDQRYLEQTLEELLAEKVV